MSVEAGSTIMDTCACSSSNGQWERFNQPPVSPDHAPSTDQRDVADVLELPEPILQQKSWDGILYSMTASDTALCDCMHWCRLILTQAGSHSVWAHTGHLRSRKRLLFLRYYPQFSWYDVVLPLCHFHFSVQSHSSRYVCVSVCVAKAKVESI